MKKLILVLSVLLSASSFAASRSYCKTGFEKLGTVETISTVGASVTVVRFYNESTSEKRDLVVYNGHVLDMVKFGVTLNRAFCGKVSEETLYRKTEKVLSEVQVLIE